MDLKVLIVFGFFIVFVESNLTFKNWLLKYNLNYRTNSPEFNRERKQSFDVSVAFVTVNKLKYNFEYELGLNGFADVPFQQFQNSFNGLILPSDPSQRGSLITYKNFTQILPNLVGITPAAPASVDYRNYSLPVLNQKLCNSCWAFSTLSAIESKLMMKNSSFKTPLSAQSIVDCDTVNLGCSGGWPTKAFNWILQNNGNGVPSADAYPYYGYQMKCRNVPKIPVNLKAVIQDYTNGDEVKMKDIVANSGPIVVAFHVTSYFQLYSDGIFYDPTCNTKCSVVNHAIVIVGYGTDPVTKNDYWIIKNSWGTSWGKNGYGFIARNKGNQCNIACWAIYTT
ncbi:cathepsin K-like [Chironomus tepperi]|uniref:cathepsin K-like n=1 Tax=Chironomus tepperi TaxID=113505 RepID=UPI00391F9DB2